MDYKSMDNNTLLDILYQKLNMKRHINNGIECENNVIKALKTIEEKLGNEEITKF